MERTTTLKDNFAAEHAANPLNNPAIAAKVETAARSAHDATDKIAEGMHRAVDGAAATAHSTAGYAASMIDQAKQTQTKVLESTCATIRARPLTTVIGALIGGYLLGRLARL